MRQGAGELVKLLEYRHSKDVFVGECKLGSSHAGCRRLDGWALLKTWSPPTIIGYEIKVSRSDFLGDRKWPDYLPVCHELYFVCPSKLIAVEELPQEVGLLWTAGSRLVTKRKAIRRQPDPVRLVELMSYVLMSRTRIVGDMWEAAQSEPREFWRAWLEEREDDRRLGQQVGRRIRELYAKALSAKQRAESERDRLQGVKDRLSALGLDGDRADAWAVDRLVRDGDSRRKLEQIRRLAVSISELSA